MMPKSIAPKPRTPEELSRCSEWTIDITLGKVFNHQMIELGHEDLAGYIIIGTSIKGRYVYFRRCHVIWWAATGKWPTQQIDHINRNKADDAYHNLREASPSQNCCNKEHLQTRILPRYIYWSKQMGKYYAQVRYLNRYKYLGSADTVEGASKILRLWATSKKPLD